MPKDSASCLLEVRGPLVTVLDSPAADNSEASPFMLWSLVLVGEFSTTSETAGVDAALLRGIAVCMLVMAWSARTALVQRRERELRRMVCRYTEGVKQGVGVRSG